MSHAKAVAKSEAFSFFNTKESVVGVFKTGFKLVDTASLFSISSVHDTESTSVKIPKNLIKFSPLVTITSLRQQWSVNGLLLPQTDGLYIFNNQINYYEKEFSSAEMLLHDAFDCFMYW